MSEHSVALFDAFTQSPLGGSVAAMFDDASGLTAEQMQRIAKEFGAPATCFVTAANPDSVDVRFFSTMTEYPMCGHATMGLMTWMVDRGIVPCERGKTSKVTLRTPARSADVDVRRRDDERIEVMLNLAPAPFEAAPIGAVELAGPLGISRRQFADTPPVELSRSDFVHLIVPLRNSEAMRAIKPDFGALASICQTNGIGTIAVLTTETVHPSSTIHCREFAPALGTPEAPASGTTNRALACYLLRHGLLDRALEGKQVVVAEQGYEMGRPSEIRTELMLKNGAITELRVGGVATKSMQGQFFLGDT
jgi:trans-2,3-dihydro-3-hydroxyanthranilate isomerase